MKKARLHFILVLLAAVVLIWPLFKTKYLDYWGSIDSTFIADARYLSENWPHPGWQPLWYGGTRFDYIYPPALRYGSAAIAKYTGVSPARGYHLYTAILYALGIAGVWLLVYTATRSLASSWLGAAGAAILSPSLLFLAHIRADAYPYIPQRLNVLLRYGEGPHISSLAVLPFVFAAAWFGLRGGHPVYLALASVAAALVVSINFYGATALALFFPLLAWAIFITTRDVKVWGRAALVAVFAYGLTAFWLTPSFLVLTKRNLAIVSSPGNAWSVSLALLLAALFAWFSWQWAAGKPEHTWTVFVTGSALFVSLNIFGHYFTDKAFRVVGEPERLVPELDLFLVLVSVEGLRRVWNKQRFLAVVLTLAAFATAFTYLKYPWRAIRRTPTHNDRIEYKIADWVQQNHPNARTFTSGTVRFWWNAWHNGAQIGGGSEQGLINFDLMMFYWNVFMGEQAEPSILWLQALGTDLIVINDERAKLEIRDLQFPQRFRGKLPIVFDDGSGNWIHQVPRRWPSLARVVVRSEVEALQPIRNGEDVERLAPYVHALEQGPDSPAPAHWLNSRTLAIDANIQPGQALAVQVTYDSPWHATSNGQPVPVVRDVLGQLRLLPPPGQHHIVLHWDTPLENQIGRALFLLTVLALAALIYKGRKK